MAKQPSHKHRALKMLEDAGWTVADVEKWIPRTNVRVDLFGFADLLCVKDGQTLAVQVTAVQHGSKGAVTSSVVRHVEKLLAEPRLVQCLQAGWLVEIWGIRNVPTADGETVRVRSFELSDDGESIIVFEGSQVLVPINEGGL